MHTNHLELIRGRHSGRPADPARRSFEDDGGPSRPTSGAEDDRESLAGVAVAQEVAELRQEVEGLRRRLLTLPAIEQAKGVLIGFYAIDADAAFALLVGWSQHTNIKLHLLASDLVTAANDSSGHPHAQLRRFIDRLPSAGRHAPAAARGLTAVAVPA